MSRVVFKVRDYSDEYSSIGWDVAPATTAIQAADLVAAIAGLTRGTIGDSTLVNEELITAGSTARPASPDAQREDKWVCTYRDVVLDKTFRLSLPTADRTLLAGGTEELSGASAEFLALKTEFDQYVISPYGNAVELESIYYVAVAL